MWNSFKIHVGKVITEIVQNTLLLKLKLNFCTNYAIQAKTENFIFISSIVQKYVKI